MGSEERTQYFLFISNFFSHFKALSLSFYTILMKNTIDDAKNHQVEDLVSLDGRSCSGSCLRSKPARKLEKEVPYIGVVFAKNISMLKSKRGENCLERKMTWSSFWVSICVYLWIMLFPFFYSCFPVFMDNEFWHLWIMASVS